MKSNKKVSDQQLLLSRISKIDHWKKQYVPTESGYRRTYESEDIIFVEQKDIGKIYYSLNGREIDSRTAGKIINLIIRKAKPVPNSYNDSINDVSGDEINKLSQIGMKNFVVRRNIFKCRFNGHKVQNIEAAISLIKNKQDAMTVTKRISAGFCPVCNTYFIMNSTYEKLKNLGIPCCRIIDSNTYEGNSVNGSLELSSESVLMQCGYTVNQSDGLTEKTRHKILAQMIDNGILSKSEIIGYLDFFISQRQYDSKYELAISKWELDADFVRDYRIGQYEKYGVNAIYR
ncbi:hypothetical protein SAMN02745229_01216 [Butyrivibrio fibrisolvens DSM 3071]|uniref:Uncharacterized protein n=1 Tax=Butyrivibrio fibrisolvens DSM 3071 TaxID=1121131 RepID=A0A1M5X0D5_BUTFI|nr:hypothetical protein [Butyrivibrio fibrisolvens]SHH93329.1 hypothetical protein SAMN02745229_01216 [Butyrivibrio fibrisolvens DSM 3071]